MSDGKEKRLFRRYYKNHDLVIQLKNTPFVGKVVNYSVEGLCASLEKAPPVTPDDDLKVYLKSPPINHSAKVMWIKKLPEKICLGLFIRRPITGALADFQLVDVLIGLQRSRKTGVFVIESPPAVKKIYIRNGDLIFSDSNQLEDSLGDMLLREKRITKKQYDESVELIKKTGRKQGAILTELGYITPRELIDAVKRQIEQIILSVFSLEGGTFYFNEGPLPTDEIITLRLSAANLIYRGLKKSGREELFLKEGLFEDAFIGVSSYPLDRFQPVEVEETDKQILSLISGGKELKEILRFSPIDRMETLNTIYALLGARVLEVKDDRHPSCSAEAEAALEKEGIVAEELAMKIDDMVRRCETQNYYEILGVEEWANLEDIKAAFYTMAKQFHPDIHFYLPHGGFKDKLSGIFSYLSRAYSTLQDPEKRKHYDLHEKNKDAKAPSGHEVAKARFRDGERYFKEGDLAEAERHFAIAAYHDPDKAEYHYYYGLTLSRIGKLKEASRALNRALKKAPLNPDILAESGHIFIRLGFPERAKGNFDRALGQNPSHSRALEGLLILKSK